MVRLPAASNCLPGSSTLMFSHGMNSVTNFDRLPQDMKTVRGLTFSVQLKPGNVTNEILTAARDEEGALKLEVGVTPRPINGAANSALISLFAKELRLPKSAIKIVSGESARFKKMYIKGDVAALTTAIIAQAVQKP